MSLDEELCLWSCSAHNLLLEVKWRLAPSSKYQTFQSLLVGSLWFYAFRWNLKLNLLAAFSAARPKFVLYPLRCSVVPILMTTLRNKAQIELELGSAPQGAGQRWCCAAAHTVVPLEHSGKQNGFKHRVVKATVPWACKARGASRGWQLRHFHSDGKHELGFGAGKSPLNFPAGCCGSKPWPVLVAVTPLEPLGAVQWGIGNGPQGTSGFPFPVLCFLGIWAVRLKGAVNGWGCLFSHQIPAF